MKGKLAKDEWWVGSMSMLLFSNAVLFYWIACETFGWQNGAFVGDILYYLSFFPALFLAPVAALLGFLTAIDFFRVGNTSRAAILAFLTGGAVIAAFVSWSAVLGGGR